MREHAPHLAGDATEGLARLFGHKTALVDERTGARISYADLALRVSAVASTLAELGARAQGEQPPARVAVLAKNRIEHIEVMFACARLGALFVPLNWRLAEAELSAIVSDAAPAVLLHDGALAAVAARLCSATQGSATQGSATQGTAQALDLDATDANGFSARVAAAARLPAVAQVAVSLESPWIVLYTSGTTGVPKGALLPYRQVLFNAQNTAVALDLTSNDSTISYTPFFHTGGLHVLTTPLLLRGGTVVVADGSASFDAARFLALNVKERCTLLFGVPTTFEMMAGLSSFDSVDLSHVRLALCGGAPCPLSLIERYNARGIVFKQGYGLTEVGPNVLNLNAEDVVRKAGSAGRPNLFISARVVDDHGKVVSAPGRGELLLGGPCVCAGYWQKPDATAQAFTADGWFKTGDVVEIDAEGFMTIVDRKKDMFISGGENVYPAEVEKVLADHPAVRGAAVVGVPDARWGEVGRAYVELRAGSALEPTALLSFAKARLASYKVPKDVVVLDELPKNSSGKIQKHALAKSTGEARS